ncbi:Rtf1p [Sugiyamaella lignohabitans]|uniref:Rtf1p n=1 Tax=Sugiyamaella lignohabitans TaxID=796027 RepID=A0A167DZE0_9ASCO|nr:Rtf1p [Sugiyamaella lignohabitans]ANB13471.1 Rtf1p [Sugiyamaella lignohabitans]
MSDLDDDLLALAGAGSDDGGIVSDNEELERRTSGKKRSRNANYDDESDFDEEEEEEDDDEGEDVTDDDEEATEEEDLHSVKNPYPLEGKYKDEQDKAYLEGLAEVERETILFDRSQEMQKFQEMEYLAQRARERKQTEKALKKRSKKQSEEGLLATKRSTRDKTGGIPSTKKSKLSELKQKRQEKHHRKAGGLEVPYRRGERDSSEDEEDEGYFEDEDEGYGRDGKKREDEVEWAETKPSKEVTYEDLNKIKFGKTLFSRFCHNPGFEDVVIGTFVRINIGFNREKQANVYRVCQVKEVVKASKPYTFLGRTVDENIRVAYADSERTFEMGICSDQSITEEEFRSWKSAMDKSGLSVISKRRVDRKLEELTAFQSRVLTAEEVNQMIQRRQKLSGKNLGANIVLEKSVLQQRRVIALEQNNFEELEQIDQQIESIDRMLNKSKRRSEIDKLAKVNERNRRANLDEIRKAEVLANETRRKLTKDANISNPFNRLRTSARIFYRTGSQSESPAPAAATEQNNEESITAVLGNAKHIDLDELIASLDIPLEITI